MGARVLLFLPLPTTYLVAAIVEPLLNPSINCSHGSLKEGVEVKDEGNKPLIAFVSKSATNDMLFFLIVEEEGAVIGLYRIGTKIQC